MAVSRTRLEGDCSQLELTSGWMFDVNSHNTDHRS
jgi:hypothetical protein